MRLAMSNDTTGARGRVRAPCCKTMTGPSCLLACTLPADLLPQSAGKSQPGMQGLVEAALPAGVAAHHETCLAARELQPSLDTRRHSWGCVQLQEASLQLARTQHSYDELQRKQESLISEMEDAIARRTAIQIKVSAPPAASLVTGCVLCAPCKGYALVRVR